MNNNSEPLECDLEDKDLLEKLNNDLFKDDVEESRECDEDFYDVEDGENVPSLEESMKLMKRVYDMFFQNKFAEAIAITEEHAKHSLFHSATKSLILGVRSCFNWDQEEINTTVDSANQTIILCKKNKNGSFLSGMMRYFWSVNFNNYTDLQLHAELFYCEMILLKALLIFIRDRSFYSFIKFGFAIKYFNGSAKEFMSAIKNKNNWQSQQSLENFKSNVYMASGVIQLFVSQLPSLIRRMIKMIGFSDNKQEALEMIDESIACRSMYSSLAKFFPSGFYCYWDAWFGLGCADLKKVENLVDSGLKDCPNSAWFLLFKGKIRSFQGKFDEAINYLQQAIDAKMDLPQLNYFCHWELSWCNAFTFNWDEAIKHNRCWSECKWSEALCAYEKASFLYMKMITQNLPDLKSEITEIYQSVPNLTRRFAGRRLTPEKIIAEHSLRYLEQGEAIALPIMESVYMYNGFNCIKNNRECLENYLKLVDGQLISKAYKSIDEYAYLMFYNGILQRLKKNYKEAEESFNEIIKIEGQLNKLQGIAAQTCLELGLMNLEIANLKSAKDWLSKAMKYNEPYWSRVVVHVRVQCAVNEINRLAEL